MDILNVFLSEHEHVRSMLRAFDRELASFEEAKTADYEILGGCISYCLDYLDQWHHPREDLMLELMSRRDCEASRSLQGLVVQHEDLARWTADLERTFHDVSERGAVYPREDLVGLGRKLSSAYKDHLGWEERKFFPAARAILLDEDWQELTRRVEGPQDPMSVTPVNKKYQMLFAALSDGQAA